MSANNVEFGQLLSSAIDGDVNSSVAMIRQFIPDEDEKIYFAEYFGEKGFWTGRIHSFAALTDRRVISLKVGLVGSVFYQDAYFEDMNSGLIHQPSLMGLYKVIAVIGFLALLPSGFLMLVLLASDLGSLLKAVCVICLLLMLGFGLTRLLLPLAKRLFYLFNKSGLVCVIREGVSVYCFADRDKIRRASQMYRMLSQLREQRRAAIREPISEIPARQRLTDRGTQIQPSRDAGAIPDPLRLDDPGLDLDEDSDLPSETAVQGTADTSEPEGELSPDLLKQARRLFDIGQYAKCRGLLDQVRPSDRTADYNGLYQRTVRVMQELSEIREKLNEKIRQKSFAGREVLLSRMTSLEPGNRKAAADLEALKGRRETARELLSRTGGQRLVEGSELHTRLLWVYRSIDSEADRSLTNQCRTALNLK